MPIVKKKSTITCPECGNLSEEEMPTDSCQFFWECPECGKVLKPQKGDCCVFCSYGDTPCPPIQKDRSCC
ncbi:MAG: GDCCVxC domain-containing (seleno)protein [Balneolaceae bacterium]|nr:GDCCVxC domain-containing (seleno)protein [Balneolaceae bacterium]MDR9407662.1 GDCCVxC domain-containing (seleno)protein [Balneolaceae bacterium]